MNSPKSLIINSPFDRPTRHWRESQDRTLTLIAERRSAGYELYDIRNNTRRTERLELVNRIRSRVDAWRAAGYPGVTSVTRRLLKFNKFNKKACNLMRFDIAMSKTAINRESLSARRAVLPGLVLLTVLGIPPASAADPSAPSAHPDHHAGMHGAANAAASGQGVINSVDRQRGVVNIAHGPMPALGWPEMTMELPVTEGVDLEAIQAGDAVRFRLELGADQVYRITAIEAMP